MFHRDIIVVLTSIFTVTCYHSVGYPLHSTGCPTVIIDDFTRAMPKTQHSKQMRAKKRHLVWSLRFEATEYSKSLLERAFEATERSKALLEHALFFFQKHFRTYFFFEITFDHACFSFEIPCEIALPRTVPCFELYFVLLHRHRKVPYTNLVYI